jgi:glycosyltransferase involved in cell wall biosynthesis
MPADHILIPIHDFSAGGTELIAFRLARAWVASGRRVTLLAGADAGPLRSRVPDGVGLSLLSPERPRSALSRLFLGRPMADAARKLAPDAIFIPGNFHFILARALKAALPTSAIVAKVSNPIWQDGPLPAPLARRAVSLATRGVDRLVAMSGALMPELTRYVPQERISIIADPFLDDDRAIMVRESAIPQDRPLRLLMVARLEEQKDPLLALRALAALRTLRPATLTILGDGPLRPAMEREIAALGLQGAVTLAGYVSDPAPHYAGADMLLMTSRFEGVPAVIGEALSAGLPFIATPCSPWVSAIAGGGALGRISHSRDPGAIAQIAHERALEPMPEASVIASALAPHRLHHGAQAYLTLFESIVGEPPVQSGHR